MLSGTRRACAAREHASHHTSPLGLRAQPILGEYAVNPCPATTILPYNNKARKQNLYTIITNVNLFPELLMDLCYHIDIPMDFQQGVRKVTNKFVASYSGGKDSVLAIYRAILQGMAPLAFITTFNSDRKRSCFHGIPKPVLAEIEKSVGVPVWLMKTSGDDYAKNFEMILRSAKEQGANACVFGDIDIEGHLKWCTERCENAGTEPIFPLYGHSRESVVCDFIESGFTAHITIVDTTRISSSLLGKQLTKETLREIEAQGADICGENGEYHTFVSNGPIFKRPVRFSFAEKIMENNYAILPYHIIPITETGNSRGRQRSSLL